MREQFEKLVIELVENDIIEQQNGYFYENVR